MDISNKIASKEANIAIIGMGYVGLPLAVAIAEAGFTITGIDVDANKADSINSGVSYIPDVPSEIISDLVEAGRFTGTTDFSKLSDADVISICVPTPLSEMHEPDISYVKAAAEQVATYIRPGQLVILESTTYPGTTVEIIQPILEVKGVKVGEDICLAFSPERVDPGNERFGIKNTPKVVGGVSPACTKLAASFYGQFVDTVVPVSSTQAAEMTKLLENIFRCVNIALVNELMLLCDRMDIDIWEVIEAASSKPFGFMPFFPGPGLGGHCIPIDPFYLSWKARQYDFHTEFIELAGKTNENIPYYVVNKVAEALNNHKKSVNGSKILVLGLAYKKDIGDTRESPALKIISLLEKLGADIAYFDPYVAEQRIDGIAYTCVALSPQVVAESDCVLLITDHSNVDYQMVSETAKLIVDTRNKMKQTVGTHIVRI